MNSIAVGSTFMNEEYISFARSQNGIMNDWVNVSIVFGTKCYISIAYLSIWISVHPRGLSLDSRPTSRTRSGHRLAARRTRLARSGVRAFDASVAR